MADAKVATPGKDLVLAEQAVRELEAALMEGQAITEIDADPGEMVKMILSRILNAATEDEVFAVGSAEPWQEYIGLPIELSSFHFQKSRFDEGAPIFFVVEGTELENGERVTLTTSGKSVMAQVVQLAKLGKLVGARVKLVKAKTPTAAGFYPLWLERA